MTITPTAKNDVRTTASAASALIRRLRSSAVKAAADVMPATNAPRNNEEPRANAMARPGNTVWVKVSAAKLRRRSTTWTPTAPAKTPSRTASMSARWR